MKLSRNTVGAILERLSERGQHPWETASDYGEPGYSHSMSLTDEDTPIVVLGYYWCSSEETGCDYQPEGENVGRNNLHSLDVHWPRLMAQLEAQGVQFEWSDEWEIPSDHDKAYRTKSDSYLWKPSIVWNEDNGEWLTPDDDVDEWIDWATNDPERCLTLHTAEQVAGQGFTQYGDNYEHGHHPGQEDDPKTVLAALKAEYGDDTDVVFVLKETSQFYIVFTAWWRVNDDDEARHDEIEEGELAAAIDAEEDQ